MGQLIDLADHRAKRNRPVVVAMPSGFYYDLSCPFSYLAAERVERLLGEAAWHPAPRSPDVLARGGRGARRGQRPAAAESRSLRADAENAAAALRLPLSWPERFGADCRGLHRAAIRAAEFGAGARFALAALRLGFCGGFDLSDPAIIVEAAAAAGVPVETCLDAAIDETYDAPLDEAAAVLDAASVRERPAIQVGQRFFEGRHAVVEAAALRSEWQHLTTRPAS
jgi:2-hydroxychromene-2-carboxylate isomerase